MAYYDKFGDKELIKAATICFCWSYYLRLQYQKSVWTVLMVMRVSPEDY